jgi:CheY-like chemotaxis protein
MGSARRAAALTQRLLAFARRQPLDPRRLDVSRLVAGMGELLRGTLGPEIELELDLAEAIWPTLCDPNQLESAILNLAINARDAMPHGGRLTIRTANRRVDAAEARTHDGDARAGEYVALTVVDTGVGMPPDIAAKAFDPFFTTKPLGQGTGLGLSMLYGFVRQSGGFVRVRSAVGQGTTMALMLPHSAGAVENEDGTQAGASDAAPAEGAPARNHRTVVVVDDETTVRMLVAETVGDLGYIAREASDGAAALRILDAGGRVDLLVTDVGLPGLNGRQLADAARVTRPELKVLFITGYAHHAALGSGSALEPGMELMTKPFALDDLATRVRTMVEGA